MGTKGKLVKMAGILVTYQLLHSADLSGKLVKRVLVVGAGRGVVHLFDTKNHHLDSQQVDETSVLTGPPLNITSGTVTPGDGLLETPHVSGNHGSPTSAKLALEIMFLTKSW